jgi:xanthine/uracil/vitamin C permease (AzgA family)
MKIGLLSIIFIFLFMDIFDTVGTLAGVGELGGFMRQGKLPRAGKAMLTDAVGTCVGAACGTPTVTSYIESAAGIASGARSGLASVVTGLVFFCRDLFLSVGENDWWRLYYSDGRAFTSGNCPGFDYRWQYDVAYDYQN